MIGGTNPSLANLASIYVSNNYAIAESLARIASGKRVQVPGDDFAGYARASKLQTDVSEYEDIKNNITDVKGVADYAAGVGNTILEDLDTLKDLKARYDESSDNPAAQAGYQAEYAATIFRINDTKDDSSIDNVQVYRAGVLLKSVAVNAENSSLTINIQASKIGNEAAVNNIASVTADAIQNEINNAQVYVAEMNSFSTLLQRQMNLTDTIINSKQSTILAITDIDDVQELSTLTLLQVRQEATIAMMAQANIIQGYTAQLYSSSIK